MILAMDTSGGELILAVVDDSGNRVGGSVTPGARHQAVIIDAIQAIAPDLSVLNAIAVAVGPGSHTGLRVGLATASGLAFGRRLDIVPVSSLAVAAHRADVDRGLVTAGVSAGRGRVHVQVFQAGAGTRSPASRRVLLPLDRIRADGADSTGVFVAEAALMEAAAAAGVTSQARINPGDAALAAAAIEAKAAGKSVAYDRLQGDYGELAT